MEARGYDPMNIRGHFVEIANLKRQDALKKVERRKKKWKERPIFFLKQLEPAFPSIEKSIRKHFKLLHRDSEVKELYQKFVHNILQTPEKFKGTFMPIKTTEEKTRNH